MGRAREFDIDVAIDAAVDTFWQHGYEGSAMQDLCRAMEIQPGSAYAAFGGKRDLYLRAARRYTESVSSEAIARIHGAESGLQGIREYFTHLVDAMVDGKRRWGCLITNSLVEFGHSDPELATMFQAHLARLETAFAAALTRARSEDELREGTGPAAAGMLVALVQGMNVMAKTQPGRPALESIAESAIAGIARPAG